MANVLGFTAPWFFALASTDLEPNSVLMRDGSPFPCPDCLSLLLIRVDKKVKSPMPMVRCSKFNLDTGCHFRGTVVQIPSSEIGNQKAIDLVMEEPILRAKRKRYYEHKGRKVYFP